MAVRSMWKGSIRFSLVSVSVEAFTASEAATAEVHLNQLHDECHSRIRYKKTCPIHGEVSNDQIVSGYEYEKDHYVIIDRKEVEKAQADAHSIVIDTFIPINKIDPIYYDGRTYYLAADAPAAEKPYAVLAQAMSKLNCCGVATVVLHGKEQLLLIRPIGPVLAMTMLRYQSQIRSPNSVVKVEPEAKASSQELKLAQQLIESSMSTKFDFSQYEDRYTDQLKELINAKIAGRQVIEPPQAEEYTPVINLMDALRKSVQKTKLSHKGKLAHDELKSRLAGRGQTKRQQRRKSS